MRTQSMAEKNYVFEYFLCVARRGDPPNPWVWEIRSKSKSEGRYFSADGFRSAKAAEEAGKIVLAEIRKATLEIRVAKAAAGAAERVRRKEIAAGRKIRMPLPPERRSENARVAALARAKALSPERRSEIARKGGAASKGKPKVGKAQTAQTDSK
jgi:general stress protein YciG